MDADARAGPEAAAATAVGRGGEAGGVRPHARGVEEQVRAEDVGRARAGDVAAAEDDRARGSVTFDVTANGSLERHRKTRRAGARGPLVK